MQKVVLIAIMSLVCIGLVSSCACPKNKSALCPAKKGATVAKAEAGASIDQCPIMSKLNLSDAQKAEVQKICDKCAAAGSSKKACKKMTKELEKVLTSEQMTQFEAACDEMKAKSVCCMKAKKKSDKPARESK